jgi:hypothetical protein
MEYSIFELVRLKASSLVKPKKKTESTFISKPILLTKVKAYDDNLDYNSQANYLFTQIKKL